MAVQWMSRALAALLGLVVCAQPITGSAAQHGNRDAELQQVLEQSGIDRLIERMPDIATGVLKQSSGALEPEMNSALSAVFSQTFQPATLRRETLQVLRAHYDAPRVRAYLAQQQTPLARRITQLERAVTSTEQQQAMREYSERLKTRPATPQRQKLVERLDKATRGSALGVDVQTAFFRAVFTAVDPALAPDMKLTNGEMDKMVREVQQSLTHDIGARTRLFYHYAYRDLPDTDLEAHVKQCESAEHRWMAQLLGNAVISSINQAAGRAATLMQQSSRAQK